MVALRAHVSPFKRVARALSFIVVDNAAVNLCPGFTFCRKRAVLLKNPTGVGDVLCGWREADVMTFDNRRIQSAAAEMKAAQARGARLVERTIGVADAAGGIGNERRRAHSQAQRAGHEFGFTFRVNELVEVNEHFDAKIAREIIASGARAEFAHARTRGSDLVDVDYAYRCLDAGVDFDR